MFKTTVLPTPKFTKTVVQDNRTDGYWIETFWVDPNDKVPGLIGYVISMFFTGRQPQNKSSNV